MKYTFRQAGWQVDLDIRKTESDKWDWLKIFGNLLVSAIVVALFITVVFYAYPYVVMLYNMWAHIFP